MLGRALLSQVSDHKVPQVISTGLPRISAGIMQLPMGMRQAHATSGPGKAQ